MATAVGMTFFCVLFDDEIGHRTFRQPWTLRSLATARALGLLHVATDDTRSVHHRDPFLRAFDHLRYHAYVEPAVPWEDRVEWLKARFLEEHLGRGAVVYVETDMLFPPDALALFAEAFRPRATDLERAPAFDVAYTLRSAEWPFGVVNSGVILFSANRVAVDWVRSLSNMTDEYNVNGHGSRQFLIDERLYQCRGAPKRPVWDWPARTMVTDARTGARVMTLPLYPLNVLEGACESPGVLPSRVTSLVTRLVTRHTASNGASNELVTS